MKVLILHNRYRQAGGEDRVVESEANLLRAHGVEVLRDETDNQIRGERVFGAIRLGLAASWSRDSYRRIRKLCLEYQPDVAHVHNFWMTLSPSVHAACHAAGVPTVQTLHNFRLLCTNALLMHNGRVCEDCLGKVPWRGVVRRCYRDSCLASTATFKMIVSNRARGTWLRSVDAFIALSELSRSKFITGALPADRIFVKPNFVEDPGTSPVAPSESEIVLYAGRLSKEKGLGTLLSAWARVRPGLRGRLHIVGDGPDSAILKNQALSLGLRPPEVVFLGLKTSEEVLQMVATARAVVLPSIWFENFPCILAEAFSRGRPVIVSDLGALAEIVRHQYEGLRFRTGDDNALASALQAILVDDTFVNRLGNNARASYLSKYTPDENYRLLMHIYRSAMDRKEEKTLCRA